MTLSMHQTYAAALGTGAVALGWYACVLYQRKLRLRRHQLYMDTMIRGLETLMRLRRSR